MTSLFFIDDATDPRAELRGDAGAMRRLRDGGDARYMLVRRGRVQVRMDDAQAHIAWFRRGELSAAAQSDSTVVFLGCQESQPRFAVISKETPLTANDRFRASGGVDADGFIGLYEAAMSLAPLEAQLAARAAHFANWINRTRYCGTCGAAMSLIDDGHKQACTNPQCAREEFPRTDPVVIALVIRGERCLLGRQARFPVGRYSAIAGFVEPGETLEAAVRREVQEEVGIAVTRVTYKGSQPWPFPASLMLGFQAEAAHERITLNDHELEDARWFERAELAEVASGTANPKLAIALPPPGVMARLLIDEWLSAGR
jgi:NAD+ diphosphatase